MSRGVWRGARGVSSRPTGRCRPAGQSPGGAVSVGAGCRRRRSSVLRIETVSCTRARRPDPAASTRQRVGTLPLRPCQGLAIAARGAATRWRVACPTADPRVGHERRVGPATGSMDPDAGRPRAWTSDADLPTGRAPTEARRGRGVCRPAMRVDPPLSSESVNHSPRPAGMADGAQGWGAGQGRTGQRVAMAGPGRPGGGVGWPTWTRRAVFWWLIRWPRPRPPGAARPSAAGCGRGPARAAPRGP